MKHATIHDFRFGVSDRGASIRIPMATANDGYGYLEDPATPRLIWILIKYALL